MKNDSYSINDKEIIIGENRRSFDFNIEQVICVNDVYVILLDIPTGITYNENVFAVNAKCNIIWRIEKLTYNSENCPFVRIRTAENKLYLDNWCSTIVEVDPETGKVLDTKFYK